MEAEAFAHKGYTVIGTDLSPGMTRLAMERFARRGLGAQGFLAADACNLPIPNHGVDVAIAYQCLHHVPDPVRALGELARVARNGIILYEPFTTPLFDRLARRGLAHRVEYSGLKPYRFTYRQILVLLKKFGFSQWRLTKYLRIPEDYLPNCLLESRWFSQLYLASMRIPYIFSLLGNTGLVVAVYPKEGKKL
jgi:ubiquinone/menaquinone biosynthesis C-methylase UbiE